MIQNFSKAWQNNRGNLLLMLGTVAGAAMCVVWYFDLVPDVTLVSRSVSGTQISRSSRSDQNPLVVALRIPLQTDAATEMPTVDLQIIVELHLPNDTLHPEQIPLSSRSILLRNDGKPQVVVFGDVQPGFYAVLAYIDLNSNDRFDCDEGMNPLEPFRLSRGTRPKEELEKDALSNDESDKEIDSDEKPSMFDLEQAAVEVVAGRATLVQFDFRLSANP